MLAIISLLPAVACLAVEAAWAWQQRHVPAGAAERYPAVYGLAYLAGGAPRAVTTALCVLHGSGTVTIAAGGTSTATGARAGDPVEAAITGALRYRAQPVATATVVARVARSTALTALAARLARQRLLVDRAAAGARLRRRWQPREDTSRETGTWTDYQWGDLPQADHWYI